MYIHVMITIEQYIDGYGKFELKYNNRKYHTLKIKHMIAIIEAVLQVTLVLIVFIAGYRIGEVVTEEYAHDKNMHE